MRPVTFAGCFGWLHPADGAALGVVMCASWEYEAAAIGQSWRVLADRFAAAGIPTLRFDYPGCGDSLGSSASPGAFDAALASIGEAVEALRSETGVARVALVGLRLGGSLALMAAEALDVEAIAMIRPVSRGKGFVAEQRALARIVESKAPTSVRRDADPGALEVEGFRLSPESVERIAKIDLTALSHKGLKRALIAGEPGSTQYDALAANLEARGVEVARYNLVDVAGWMPPPVPVPAPLADCDALAAWLRVPGASQGARSASLATLAAENFLEAAIAFGSGGELAGILCEPASARTEAPRRAVIFLNTGANSHIGAGRAAVHHARGLAEAGVASLRMDINGIGDAAWKVEGPLSAIHHTEGIVDVSAAIDLLNARGFENVALVGVCSGAFLAFQSALADPRIDRILLANPQFLLPLSAVTLSDPFAGAYRSTSAYAAKFGSRHAWKRLLTGKLRLEALRRIALELGARGRRKARSAVERLAAIPPRHLDNGELLARLRELKTRRCEATLVLSEGDPARERLADLLPDGDFAALDGLLRVVSVEGADHSFAMTRTRGEFFALIEAFLGLGRESSSAPRNRAAA